MKKVIVIGCPGSGKTTFAEKLRDKTDLPLFYLDAIWHKPDRTHISREEYDMRLSKILALDSWIIDGNYSRTLESRISACDTVFLFDLPTEVCLAGATERLGRARYDVPWVDTELDLSFRAQIEKFKDKNLPTIYTLLEKYSDKNIIIFKSREEADGFFEQIQNRMNGIGEEMLKFICYPKCTTCQKAKKLLDDKNVKYELRDIKLQNPTLDELSTWHKTSGLPLKKFFNTSGLLYKSLDLKNKLPEMSDGEMLALLASDGMLVKRPLLVGEDFVLVGFKENEWREKISK